MVTDRRFCRFSTSESTASFGMPDVPPDGFCLSAFVVVTARERAPRVLVGRLDPTAPWDHLGALDASRVEAWKDRWMLPASHLLVGEGPDAAAARILAELTGLAPRRLEGPKVVSEVYASPRHPEQTHHWDLEFLYRGTAGEEELRPHRAWRQLAFVDVGDLTGPAVARLHDDVLRSLGLLRTEGEPRA